MRPEVGGYNSKCMHDTGVVQKHDEEARLRKADTPEEVIVAKAAGKSGDAASFVHMPVKPIVAPAAALRRNWSRIQALAA